jgi:YfiH family protein
MLKSWNQGFRSKNNAGNRMNTFLYPFALEFNGLSARLPFIFEGKSVEVIKGSIGGVNTGGTCAAPSCLISNRAAGDMVFRGMHSPVRNDFFRSQGISPEKVYSLIQVHSHDVFTLGSPEDHAPAPTTTRDPAAFVQQGDGMVSFFSEAVLAVTVADCLPIVLLDTEKGYWALLHSGWKGTGIVLKALELMKNAGTTLEAVAAVLGPCIQSCCYRVDEGRAKQFEAQFGGPLPENSGQLLGPVSRQDKSGWYIDLQAANVRLLSAAGVRHISYCKDCTFSDDRLGSFRREGEQSFTRMIVMAGYAFSKGSL